MLTLQEENSHLSFLNEAGKSLPGNQKTLSRLLLCVFVGVCARTLTRVFQILTS